MTACPTCGKPTSPGRWSYCSAGCEPITCICRDPIHGPLDECQRCFRLIVTEAT